MNRVQFQLSFLFLLSSVFLLTACPSKKRHGENAPSHNARFAELKNVASAPPSIQKAAMAVVRIRTSSGFGTGFFISDDGLLVTNNHVVGIDESSLCPREGCYLNLSFNFQLDKKSKEISVFAKPYAVSAAADVSIFQIWSSSTQTHKVNTPHFLTLAETDINVGEEIVSIGHPQGTLKKWVRGRFISGRGVFGTSSFLALGGQSGSPVLDFEMKVVGIVHHSQNGSSFLSRKDIEAATDFTLASEIQNVLDSHNTSEFPSLNEERDPKWVVEHSSFYLGSRTPTAKLKGGQLERVSNLITEACQVSLDKGNYASQEKFNEDTAPCRSIVSWWNCIAPDSTSAFQYCPGAEESKAWEERFYRLFRLSESYALSGGLSDLFLLSYLDSNYQNPNFRSKSERVGQVFANGNRLQLNFQRLLLIVSLVGFDIRLDGKDVLSVVRGYKLRRGYNLEYESINKLYVKLYESNLISLSEYRSFVMSALADPLISLNDYLEIEGEAYEQGVL